MKYLSSLNFGWAKLHFADYVVQDGNTISVACVEDDYHPEANIPGSHKGILSDMYNVVVVDIATLCYYASVHGKETELTEFLAKEAFNSYSNNTIIVKVDPGTYQILPYYTQMLIHDEMPGVQCKIVKVN